jgi:hypothetical protein
VQLQLAPPQGRQQQQRQQQQQQQQQHRKRRRRRRYGAVLMDFGSARPAEVRVTNRVDALALQEDAEVRSCRRVALDCWLALERWLAPVARARPGAAPGCMTRGRATRACLMAH